MSARKILDPTTYVKQAPPLLCLLVKFNSETARKKLIVPVGDTFNVVIIFIIRSVTVFKIQVQS
jgi:hypothetical protein